MLELYTKETLAGFMPLRLLRLRTLCFWICCLNCVGAFENPAADSLPTNLLCRVVDSSTGKVIVGATVKLNFPSRHGAANSYLTDASGECRVQRAGVATTEPRLWCLADGYEAKRIDWDEIERIAVSNSFPVKLERGSRGGGLILDERGNPLPNAQIYIQGTVKEGRVEVFSPDEYHFEETGRDGRWMCAHLPGQLKDASLRVLHSDFGPVVFEVDNNNVDQKRRCQAEELRGETAIMFAQRGVTVSGIVVDSGGRPVEGAKILSQDYPTWTPVDGRFDLKNCRQGEIEALIQAQGFAPHLEKFDAANASEPMRWALMSSPGLKLKVTDSSERPLRDVAVKVEKWAGPIPGEWRWRTDAEGRITWDGAPTGDVLYSLAKPGFESLPAQPLPADERERAIKLRKILTVSGQVTDAVTGQPLVNFSVVPGKVHGDHYHWDRTLARNANGRFSVALPGAGQPRAVKIEADGYYPEVSRSFREEEEDAALDFALEKGEKLRGMVNNSKGHAVAAASVAFVGAAKTVILGRAKFEEHGPTDIQETDGAGRFLFQPRRDGETLIAVHESEGFAEIAVPELRSSPVIALRPWGRLEGTLLIHGQPGAHQLVGLSQLGAHAFLFHVNAFSALTDDEGRFHMEQVPPGGIMVGRVIRSQFSNGQAVEIQPGVNRRIVLGDSGRTVAGRVLVLDEAADWESWNHPAFLRSSLPPLEQPKFNDAAQEGAWARTYWNSAAGEARQVAGVPYVLTLEPNGRFRADDVPPGDYELEIHYHEPSASTGAPDVCRGLLKQKVTIPKAPAGQPDAPVDLGTWTLTLKPAGPSATSDKAADLK